MEKIDELRAISYLRAVYGGEVYCRNGEYHILFRNDKFKVKPSNSKKTYSFCLYENGDYECKFVDSNLIRGLFVIWNYPIYKETRVELTVEDWHRFVGEVKRFGGKQ